MGLRNFRKAFLNEYGLEAAFEHMEPAVIEVLRELSTSYLAYCQQNVDNIESAMPIITHHRRRQRTLIEWLKGAPDEDFHLFCHLLVVFGYYLTFTAFLHENLVDCINLERLAKNNSNRFGCASVGNSQIPTKSSLLLSEDQPDHLTHKKVTNDQLTFLKNHQETFRLLLIDVDSVLNYLRTTRVLSENQYLMVKNSGQDDCVNALIKCLIDHDSFSTAINRFCHALLLSHQYRLFSAIYELADVKELERFQMELSPMRTTTFQEVENDENLFEMFLPKNRRFSPRIDESVASTSFDYMHEQYDDSGEVPPADGILEHLSVDATDSESASDLPYYNTREKRNQVYKNFSRPKGLALIINNRRFQFLNEREGTDVDRRNITTLLEKLGYQVLTYSDLTALEMRRCIQEFALDQRHARAHSCVVVVLTHGEYDHFNGVDSERLNLHEFVAYTNAKHAPLLAGKPKIFFFQACRGVNKDSGVERLVVEDFADGHLPWARRSAERQSRQETDLFRIPYANNANNSAGNSTTMNEAIRSTTSSSSAFQIFSCFRLTPPPRKRPEEVLPLNNGGIAPPAASMLTSIFGSGSSEPPPLTTFPFLFGGQTSMCQNGHMLAEQQPAVQPRRIRQPTDADMLIAYATTPFYVSWRNNINGTWFIQSICEIFAKHAKDEDIITLLTRVNKRVADVYQSSRDGAKQIPEVASRLRQKFYFFPGVNSE